MISGRTRLVALLGHPVSQSLSPRMQNAAFAAKGLDWAYEARDVLPEGFEDAVRGLVTAGFAGANVTTPHKAAAAGLAETDLTSVNTLVFEDGRIHGFSTDAAVLVGLPAERPVVLGDGGAAAAFRQALPRARSFARRGEWPPDVGEADLVVNATSERDEVLVELNPGQTLVDLPYPETATARAARERGARVVDGLEVLVAQGAAAFELWTGLPAPVEAMRSAVGIARDADFRMPGSARHPSETTDPPN
jgi:shikimate dehydrogenase